MERLKKKHETDMTIRVAIERDMKFLEAELREKAPTQQEHPVTPPAKSPEKR